MAERMSATETPRPWRAGIVWMLLVLGPGFFLVYGACNWLTSLRSDVGSFFFEWERRIPVLPWTIVPYWSLDVLYAFSVLLCRTRRELDRHALRLVAAVLLSAVGFLLFPLQFAFPRPEVEGIFEHGFQTLYGFDQPFNQAPSLHISLGLILWRLYAKHARGPLRGLLHGWFALIGISTLTTWQHHFIDVPAGALVGVLAFLLFPDPLAAGNGKAIAYRPLGGVRLAWHYGVGAYVHCALGYSRSAHVAAHWLAATGRVGSMREAFERIRAVRPGIVVAPDRMATPANSSLVREAA